MAQTLPHGHAAETAWPWRQLAPAWVALIVLAALAWVVTIRQASDMGIGPGTMGLALPAFLVMWVAMMSAMMFPSVAPVAIMWSRTIVAKTSGGQRAWRIATFVTGYLIAWTSYGLAAFAALLATQRLLDAAPGSGRWLGFAVFATAGAYQLTGLKNVCLRHCRSPMMSFLHYANFKGKLRDLRVGAHHGLYCVGCCWGLMLVLVAVGVMNVAAMAALAIVIFLEKLAPRGAALSKAVGVAFSVAAVAVLLRPELLPALHQVSNEMGGMR